MLFVNVNQRLGRKSWKPEENGWIRPNIHSKGKELTKGLIDCRLTIENFLKTWFFKQTPQTIHLTKYF